MKLTRGIFLGTVYLGELLLILFVVLLALNLRSVATPKTASAFPLAATTLIHAPTSLPPVTTKPTGPSLTNTLIVGKNAPANLDNRFQLTYVGEFRDRIIFGPTQADWKYSKGVYATIQFRVKNLQAFSDSLAQNYDLFALTEDGQTIPSESSVEINAVWLYCQCDTDRRVISPGEESVFVITFDVPVSTQTLVIVPTRRSISTLQSIAPRFNVVNFDHVRAWR